jgi:hypothetical protein
MSQMTITGFTLKVLHLTQVTPTFPPPLLPRLFNGLTPVLEDAVDPTRDVNVRRINVIE